jgi:hypothetical protein
VFFVRYEQGFYIQGDGILHSYRRKYVKSYAVHNRIADGKEQCGNIKDWVVICYLDGSTNRATKIVIRVA